jgi:putative Holliday junction resolvase
LTPIQRQIILRATVTTLPKNETDYKTDLMRSEIELAGRILALDLGQKRVGVAVSDETRLAVRALPNLNRTNWKQLLKDVAALIREFDAKAMVIGLPLRLDGQEGEAAIDARRIAKNFALSLAIPVYLQDERLTSQEAESELRSSGFDQEEIGRLVDGESAVIIARDFLAGPPGSGHLTSEGTER